MMKKLKLWILTSLSIFALVAPQLVIAAANNANNPTRPKLFIDRIFVTDPVPNCGVGNETLTIEGKDFDNGNEPIVVFGDHTNTSTLLLCSVLDGTEIVAELPDTLENLAAGDYRIEVYTGRSRRRYDAYDLTIGAVGPVGPQGDQGKIGPPGIVGIQYVTRRSTEIAAPGSANNISLPCPPPTKIIACGGGCTAVSRPPHEYVLSDAGIKPESGFLCSVTCVAPSTNPVVIERAILEQTLTCASGL